MSGGLIHIAYVGIQDKILTQAPEITFFKIAYCQHSTFAIQDHYIQSETDVQLGDSTYFKLRHYGDLVFRPYIKITVPEIVASYDNSIDEMIMLFNDQKKIKNANANSIITKLDAISYQHNHIKMPIYVDDNTTLIYNYENYCYSDFNDDFTDNDDYYPLISNTIPDNKTSFNTVVKYNTKSNVINNSVNRNRNIYYSSYNVNYLTTELNKISLGNDIIIIDDDFLEIFREKLYNYITTHDENKFIYSLINNKEIYSRGLDSKNIITSNTIELTFSQDYYYTNMKLLYIYNPKKQLKTIFYVDTYSYSGNNYSNNVKPLINLYTYIDNICDDVFTEKLYISNGYNNDKTMNITEIISIEKDDNMYDISFNTSDVSLNSNLLFMVYRDILPRDQGLTGINNTPGIEDYYDLYYSKIISTDTNMFNVEHLALPLCVLQYDDVLKRFIKIDLSPNVDIGDLIYNYKDVMLIDTKTQQINYILINNNMYEVMNNSGTQYSDTLYIDNKIEIVNSIVGDNLFLIDSTDNKLTVINNYTNEKFFTQDYISPYSVKILIYNDSFDNNRLTPITLKTNTDTSLDNYVDTIYNKNEFLELNIEEGEKISNIYYNISSTIELCMLYIKNVFECLFNNLIYYKYYNKYTITDSETVVNINLEPEFTTNVTTYLFSTQQINGENNFYNSLQNTIINEIDTFMDDTETSYSEIIREIFNISDKMKLLIMLNGIVNYGTFIHIKLGDVVDTVYYDDEDSIPKSKICFKINDDYLNDNVLYDLSENLNIQIPMVNDYYYIENMLYTTLQSIVDSDSASLNLIPYNGNALKEFYVLNTLLNTEKDASDNYIITDIYVLPNDIIPTDDIVSTYQITINYNEDTQNIYTLYDNIVNNNTSYYMDSICTYSLTSKNHVLDMEYLLYHYATYLYQSIRDKVNSDKTVYSGHFTKFNNMKMYENLWHFKQSIYKKSKNGNRSVLKDLSVVATNSTYYLDCNICYDAILDHIIINNSLIQHIDMYITEHIKPIITELLTNKTSYFNFYINSYHFIYSTDISSNRSLNITNLDNFKVLQWYFHYLHSVKSDIMGHVINDHGTDILDHFTIGEYDKLKEYFDTSTNIFNETYKGTNNDLSVEEYNKITQINTYIASIITHLKYIIGDNYINLEDGTRAIFTNDNFSNIFNVVPFSTMNLKYLFTEIPNIYTLNFYKNYEYKNIIGFYNNIKQQYLKMYSSLISSINNHGSFSRSYINEITQLLNFQLSDYISNMNWLSKNADYDSALDIYQYQENATNVIVEQSYFKYSLVNNPNINDDVTNIKTYYNAILDNHLVNKQIFYNNNYLLRIKYITIDEIILSFNLYFNYNYTFYSDYRLIYVLYFFMYKSYKFSIDSDEHIMTFDSTDNTSENNIITNTTTNQIYHYSNLVFSIDSKIRYTIVNNVLYDLSENEPINYSYQYILGTNGIIKNHDLTYDLHIINNHIVDLSENVVYTLKYNTIYNLENENVGTFDNDIYTINDIPYKYKITDDKHQALFANYSEVLISYDSAYIRDVKYDIKHHIFHDDDWNIVFEFVIPEHHYDGTIPKYNILYNGEYIPVSTYKIITINDDDNDFDIIKIFNETFSETNVKKSIRYLQETIKNSIMTVTDTETITNPNNVNKLLNNIVKNSILPLQNYANDTIICSTFNNWVANGHDITAIIEWLINYNTTNINLIKIFNETDQTFINVFNYKDIINKTFYFVPERLSYIPLANENLTNNPLIDDFQNSSVSTLDYMLIQRKNLANIDKEDLYTVIQSMQIKTELVKDKIIDVLLSDISNNMVSDFYDSNVYFDISSNIVTWDICQNNINPDSVFIRNSVLIDYEERNNMECLSGTFDSKTYTLQYINNNYYLKDPSENLFNISIVPDINVTEDISYNNCYFSFKDSVVKIMVKDSIFPKTIGMYDSKLYRHDTMCQGFHIDISGNLKYDFKYDINTDVMLKSINNYNKTIFDNKVFLDISCSMVTYEDLSENYLSTDKSLWDDNVILDDENYYCIIDSTENIKHEYVLLYDGIQSYLSYVTFQHNNIIKIFLHDDFTFDSDKTYIIKYCFESMIKYTGTDKLWYKAVFYYWETFARSIEEIGMIIDSYNDKHFDKQKFAGYNYIEKIFSNVCGISTMSDKCKLFESYVEHFDKIMNFNVKSFENFEIANTMIINIKNLFDRYNKAIYSIKQVMLRDLIPKCSWIDYLGHYIFDSVEFSMNNNTVEEINDQILQIYNHRNTNDNTIKELHRIIGHHHELRTPGQTILKNILYVPLPLCFEHHTKALPIIALTNTQLAIKVKLKQLSQLVKKLPGISVKEKGKVKIELSASYVFLDLEMRKKFAVSRHEYLYDIKKCYKYTVDEMKGELMLNYKNPCKEMLWFYIDQKLKDSNNTWNYTGIEQIIYDPDTIYDNNYMVDDDVKQYILKLLKTKEKYHGIDLTTNMIITALDSIEINMIKDYIKRRPENPNPFTFSSLNYSGHNRFKYMGKESGVVEALMHYNDSVQSGLNMKTFARYPNQVNHSGYNNFTICDDMRLDYELNLPNVDGTINIIINTHDLLRICSGIGCMMW